MKKTLTQIFILIIGLAILVPVVNYFKLKLDNFKKDEEEAALIEEQNKAKVEIVKPVVSSVENIPYIINGETFTLENGSAENKIASSSSTNVLEIFGEPKYADFNGDDVKDAALWLVNNSGGSGIFYYAVLAIKTGGIYKSTNAILLGDRIAPQTLDVETGMATFNFADRNQNEPMTTSPSIGKSIYVKYDKKTGEIIGLVKNPETSTSTTASSTMALNMKTWKWVSTTNNNGSTTLPKTDRFTLTFKDSKTFSATTDCNGVGGEYTVNGDKIVFDKMMSTLMYCEGSQENDFSRMITEVETYSFGPNGELIFKFGGNSGTMVFK